MEEQLLSMTKLTYAVSPDLERDTVKGFLVKEGYIVDSKTPTAKGYMNGIEIKRGDQRGVSWPVYPVSIFKPILLEGLKEELEEAKKNQSSNLRAVTKTEGIKYPYLGLDKFLIMDTETTGLGDDDEIIELALLNQDGEKLYHNYFYPSKEVEPGAAEVNHLTQDVLAKLGAVDFVDEADKIMSIIKTVGLPFASQDNIPVLGHNLKFDVKMFNQTCQKYGVNVDEGLFKGYKDSMTIAKEWLKSASYSLNNLTTLIGITREEQHNAADDCLMTKEFLDRLEDVITIKYEYNFLK